MNDIQTWEKIVSIYIILLEGFTVMLPPIAIFAYNRPKHLKVVLDAVHRSMNFYGKKFPLYIFCDAPKDEAKRISVEETRFVALAQKEAKVILRERNLGFKNIVNGISELCEHYGKVIVIEDDIIISPDFLSYMTHALNYYENFSKVFMISGFMYGNSHPIKPSTFCLTSSFIWGWGTWKRAWDHFSWHAEGWEKFVRNKQACYEYDFFGTFTCSKILREVMTKECDAWDAQWIYAMYKQKAVGVHPYRTLTWNCGIGGGIHGDSKRDNDPQCAQREYYIHGNLNLKDFTKPRLPKDVYSGFCFSDNTSVDKKAMRILAFTFLKERWATERRKRKLLLKFIKQGFLYPWTRRP